MATPPVAPGFQNQQFGEVERIERMPAPPQPMPAPPQPMQPRPSLIVGGPAFFTPEGYQAPVQPEQAFMPTDRRPDPIGDNFRRPYERPIMPMPSLTPMPMPSPTPPPEMAQPAPPRFSIEQPIKEPVIDGPAFEPVIDGPAFGTKKRIPTVMPMPVPTPQPEYDPFAYSDLGSRALGGEYINSMTFHWFDPTTGKGGSTTEGWSRVPDSAKPYTYLSKEEANEAKEKFMTFEDRGNVDTTPKRTPVTTPAPAPTVAASAPVAPAVTAPVATPDLGEAKSQVEPDYSEIFKDLIASPAVSTPAAPPVPMKPITLPGGQTVQIPDIDMEAVNASLAEYGIKPQTIAAPSLAPSLPVATPAPSVTKPAPVATLTEREIARNDLMNFERMPSVDVPVRKPASVSAPTVAAPVPMQPITLPNGTTVQIPEIDVKEINASLAEYGIKPQPIAAPPVRTPAPSLPVEKDLVRDDPVTTVAPSLPVAPALRNAAPAPAAAPVETGGMRAKLERMGFDVGTESSPITQLAPEPVATPVPMKPITLPSGQTVEIPDIDMEEINASLAAAGIIPQIPQAPAPISASAPVATEKKKSQQMLDDGADVLDVITQLQIEEGLRNEDGTPTKEASAPTSVAPQLMIPQPIVPQAMPSMPSLPSVTLPTLPTLGSRPSLTRPPMRGNPRER